VILDDLVLNVGDYITSHPGGPFLIRECIGRDISKYFYGGYSKTKSHLINSHSKTALKRALKFAIGRIYSSTNPPTGAKTFKASLVAREELIKKTIFALTFEGAAKIHGV
jgi:cytochrome b involved in lipid metabolism